MSTTNRPPRPLVAVSSILSSIAGILLLVLVVLTIADVVNRNIQDESITGTVEISTVLLVAVAFFGLASAEIDSRHVSVELLEINLSQSARMVLAFLRSILLAALAVLILWGLSGVVFSAAERGETTNDILRLATWPAKAALWVSFLVFFTVAVWKAVRQFQDFRHASGGTQ